MARICRTIEDAIHALQNNDEQEGLLMLISRCSAGDCSALSAALSGNSSIRELFLNNSGIVNIESISSALKTNGALEVLYLNGNAIKDISTFGDALKVQKCQK